MATLLLASPAKQTRGQDLKRTLLHILHGLQAVEDALETFSLAYSPHHILLSNPERKDILADFDAHVGDTACHMRAQMIWGVYQHYREPESRAWIDEALIALAQVKADTIALMVALHKKNGYMRALGFGSRVKYGQIFDRIGWSSFIDMFDKRACGRGRGHQRFESWYSDASTPMPSTPAESESDRTISDFKIDCTRVNYLQPPSGRHTQLPSLRDSTGFGDLPPTPGQFRPRGVSPGWSLHRSSTSASPSPSAPPLQTLGSHSYRSITTDCSWDITNHLTVIRFLSLCRLLSVGKRAKVQAGFPNAAIRARTDPEFIYSQTSKVIQKYYESVEQEIPWSKLITWEDMARKTFLTREEEAVQVWLSTMTADWSVKLAEEIGLTASMQSYIRTSTLISPRQVACVGSHASIVPIRAEWLLRGTPILMLIRRFCSKGYHSTFYRVSPNPAAWQSRPPFKNLCAVNVGKASWFNIVPVSTEEVQSAPWATTPHFVLISNSHEGTNGEFYDRIAEDGYGELGNPWPHEANHCPEYEAHLPKVLESNFASIVMGFFGQHDQYPFELSPETEGCLDEDGHEHVAKTMADAGFGGRALEQYWRSCKESVENGTGEHPWLYTFEHAYLELPFVVGRQAQEIMEKRIKPVPIGYRWWL